jgi:hypothetical protein
VPDLRAVVLQAGFERTFERALGARFVFAPSGYGKQDYRVWEALLAGAVPIVLRVAAQDALLEGLPVVRVDDWAEVTPARLAREWARLEDAAARGEVSWTKLFFPYWFGVLTEGLE